jgi:hypothetical protein
MRPTWLCLNGEWQFEIDPGDSGLERGLLQRELHDRTLVPFCPESSLSGYCYTQLTDVFQEQNGIYTFDRRAKFDLERLHAIQVRSAAIEQ